LPAVTGGGASRGGDREGARADRLPFRRLLAYGGPVLALQFPVFWIQFFFLKFSTDVLLVAPATVGALFAASRIWDAVSDPLAGYWSDRTRSRLGRRRPWMLLALPPLAVGFWMLWSPPASLSAQATVLWVALSLFVFYTAFTAYAVPHLSLGAELTGAHHERNRIFAVSHVAFIVGMMAAFAAIQVVAVADDPRTATSRLAAGVAVVMVVGLLAPPLLLREPAAHQGRGPAHPYRAIRDVLRNPHARLLLGVWFLENLGAGALGILSPYAVEYIVGRPDLIGVIPAFFVIAGVASVPLWLRLARRMGKRDAWVLAMVGMSLSFGATVFVGEGDLVWLSACLILGGLSYGCGGVIGPSVLADVIDWDEAQSGERKEGAYAAAWGFSWKVAGAVIIAGTGAALQASGFEPNVDQPASAQWTLRALFAGTPFLTFGIGAWLFRRYAITEAEHDAIRARLDG
jgi:GPH family glycoside/pentoside/hexuronide:cation symporter